MRILENWIYEICLYQRNEKVYVDLDDLARLLKLRDELIEHERKTKEKREEQKAKEQAKIEELRRKKEDFENKVMQNREKWDVIFNYTM